MFELISVGKRVGAERHIHDVSLRLERGTLNVLLGPTLSGKTTLMRLMAGLDRPTSGDIRVDGDSVLGMPVQQRNVAMVYQQFINYPSLSVYENIASPMRVAGVSAADIDRRVRAAAELMKLTDFLDRAPLNLSGGQQQRTALARALVKDADLVLLDEPLANLDYKLREELRAELPKLFAEIGAVLVYATTEPQEALLLGGNTGTLSQGRLTQFGPTIDVYSRPADLVTAQTFSDPPLNTLALVKSGDDLRIGALTVATPPALRELADGRYRATIRPHHLALRRPSGAALEVPGQVATSEITGSESFIHIDADLGDGDRARWVALTHDVHRVATGDRIPVYLDPQRFYLFDDDDRARLAAAPAAAGGGDG